MARVAAIGMARIDNEIQASTRNGGSPTAKSLQDDLGAQGRHERGAGEEEPLQLESLDGPGLPVPHEQRQDRSAHEDRVEGEDGPGQPPELRVGHPGDANRVGGPNRTATRIGTIDTDLLGEDVGEQGHSQESEADPLQPQPASAREPAPSGTTRPGFRSERSNRARGHHRWLRRRAIPESARPPAIAAPRNISPIALKTHPIRLPAAFHRISGPRTRNNSIVPKFRKVSESQVASHQPTSPPTTMPPTEQQADDGQNERGRLAGVRGCSLSIPHQGTDW